MPKQTVVRDINPAAPPSDLQQKVVDKPVMFRGSGLHARTTEPGMVSPKFANSNKNIPLWNGDSATVPEPPQPTDVLSTQRFKGKVEMGDKHENRRMDHFFVAKQNDASSGNNNGNGSNTNSSTDCRSPSSGGVRPDDDVHISRRGHPEVKHGPGLKPGDFCPPEEASYPRRFGKKAPEDNKCSAQTTKEIEHHGKKSFSEVNKTSTTTAATDIGSPQRTQRINSTEKLKESARFHESKRHTSNLATGLAPTDTAKSMELDYDTRKKHVSMPGNKEGRTLQGVFEPPVKKIDASYRPVAPFA